MKYTVEWQDISGDWFVSGLSVDEAAKKATWLLTVDGCFTLTVRED